ncbi:MAG: GIY-YIG nuclease family protein [Candidatus Paracaedibacteraceae bacterium]|nr:GIY-YIG nuclease family protein [Candidatus Paracaedibacteraceae bacterium]
MFYVYTLRSILSPDNYYVGMTIDLEKRLLEHNSGKSIHTNKFRPWEIVTYTAFKEKSKAEKFEIYLKSSSGRAFSKKRF